MRKRLAPLFALTCVCGVAAAQTDAAVRRPPNVLIAIADDWSYGHASALGTAWCETPHFDRIAREGVMFTRAYTPNAKCAPSRACLLTGRNPWQLGAAANHWPYFPPEHGSFFDVLAGRGYTAGFTGKGFGPGVVRDRHGAPRSLTGVRFSEARAAPPARGIANIDYAANFGAFLDSVPAGSPWVFWYGGLEPHRGYEAGCGLRAGKDPATIDRVPEFWPDTPEVRSDMLDYAVEVEHFDAHLGRILARLEARGELDDTIVIVTSDHGMPFPRVKGQAYEPSNHVPLAIRWPGGVARPGRSSDALVSLIDVAPTVLAIAGVEDPAPTMQPTTGRSLLPLLAGQSQPGREFVLIGKERHDVGRPQDGGYPIRGILTGPYLYLRNFEPGRWPAGNPETGYPNCDGGPTKSLILAARRERGAFRAWDLCFGRRGGEELYHLGADPDCVVDLSARAAWRDVAANLRARLTRALEAEADPRILGHGEIFDAFPYADPRSRGFHERFLAGEQIRAGWVQRSDFEPEPIPPREHRR